MPKDWDEVQSQMDYWARELARFLDHIDRGHTRLILARPGPVDSTLWHPPFNVYEMEDAVIVLAELAGVELDDLTVQYEFGRLSVWGKRREPIADGIQAVHRMEIQFGPFAFATPLPLSVDAEGATATLRAGFLHIRLPKRPARNQVVRINLR